MQFQGKVEFQRLKLSLLNLLLAFRILSSKTSSPLLIDHVYSTLKRGIQVVYLLGHLFSTEVIYLIK